MKIKISCGLFDEMKLRGHTITITCITVKNTSHTFGQIYLLNNVI